LIVVQDPSSRTSALSILERYNVPTTSSNSKSNSIPRPFINITIWKDEQFVPVWLHNKSRSETPLWLHLNRQAFFYGSCLKEFYHQGHRSWVLLTDTDEFVQVNQRVHALSQAQRDEPGHVSKVLMQEQFDDLCVNIPRIQMSSQQRAVGSDKHQQQQQQQQQQQRQQQHQIETIWNTSHFMTYHWLLHRETAITSGKNMINLGQFEDKRQIPARAFSVHQVLEHKCPETLKPGDPLLHPDALLVIQHYLGTHEQYMYREDPRNLDYTVKFDQPATAKREEQYFTRGRGKPQQNESNMRWLPGFVKSVGLQEATRLLQDVGIVENMPNTPSNNSSSKQIAGQSTNDDDNGMAACLLVKDDNHWLAEWLAYHYHVLPLRHLVVVRDPSSQTSPQHLWDRWAGRISVEEWNDKNILPDWIIKKHQDGVYTDVNLHRYRQQFFYMKCLKHLKEKKASWVVFVDSDEFIRPNPYLTTNNETSSEVDLSIPGIALQWLNTKLSNLTSTKNLRSITCLHIPRLQMASTETGVGIINSNLPAFVNGSHFLTTRWRYHNGKDINFGHNLDGKNVINVQWLEPSMIPNKAVSAHQIIPDICPDTAGDRLHHPTSLLLVHHYLGTFEQYTFREDPRNAIKGRPKRDQKLWKSTGQSPPATIRDDSISSWLTGFVENVGEAEAQRLLDGVGVLESS
jgi:hypothetical protein